MEQQAQRLPSTTAMRGEQQADSAVEALPAAPLVSFGQVPTTRAAKLSASKKQA